MLSEERSEAQRTQLINNLAFALFEPDLLEFGCCG
jgi:hypothetical protein